MGNAFKLPEKSLFLTVCAGEDAEDMWYRPYVVKALEKLIQAFIVQKLVDPQYVFIIGYYEGFYGAMEIVYLLGNRVAEAMIISGYPFFNQRILSMVRNFESDAFVSNYPSFIGKLHFPNFSLSSKALNSETSFKVIETDKSLNRLFDKMKTALGMPAIKLSNKFIYRYFNKLDTNQTNLSALDEALSYLKEGFARDPDPPSLIWDLTKKFSAKHFYCLAMPETFKRSSRFIVLSKSKEKGFTIYCDKVQNFSLRLNDDDISDSNKISVSINDVKKTYDLPVPSCEVVFDTMDDFGDPYLIRHTEIHINVKKHLRKIL